MAVYKMLELTVISARDLRKVNPIGKMDVYADVSLLGNWYEYKKQRIPVHRDDGGSHVHSVAFKVDESKLDDFKVVFDLKHKRAFRQDKEVGQVVVWVSNLLRKKDQPSFRYKVQTRSGENQGQLEFSVKLLDFDSDSNANSAPPPPPPPVVDADPWPAQISWVATYRRHRHEHGHHKRHQSW